MSKSFKTNLRVWLNKVYGLCKKPKKTVCSIAKKLTNFDLKESKEMLQERIADNLSRRFQEMKQGELTSADGMKAIEYFLRQNELAINQKLHEMITQHMQKFFSKTQDNLADCEDYVLDIWNDTNETYQCVCPKTVHNLKFSEQKQVCYRCQRSCHVNCLWGRQKKEELYECPMCFLRNCIPNRRVGKILFAGFLRQIKKDKIEYKINLPLENGLSQDGFIEARCVRLCKDNKYEITWPMNSTIYLNSKKLMQFKPLNTNSSIKKRVDDEIILDKRFLSNKNTLIIEERHQYMQNFRPTVYENHLVVLCEVKPLPLEEMTAQTMIHRMPVEQSKEILREYLDRGIQDCFIDQLKIKLKCQFYNSKITIPARSKHCTSHYQPFDLKGFLLANMSLRSSAQRWKCPICRERAYHLVVDDYLLNFITERRDLTEIQFNNKGDCKMVEQQQSDNQSEKGEGKVNEQFEVIECEMQDENNVRSGMEQEKQYTQFIEIISDDQEQDVIDKPKRSLNDRIQIQEISSGPQKRRKPINTQPTKSNPLSFLRTKKTSNMKEGSDVSDSEQINFQSKYSPDNSLSDFKPQRKEKRQRKYRKDRVFEQQVRKDLDKMSKILVSSPAINTVTPEAIRILDKKLPQVVKKVPVQAVVIDIESDSQNEQTQQACRELKMQYHLRELERQKNMLNQRGEGCEISASDESLFLSLCEKFMGASIKGY